MSSDENRPDYDHSGVTFHVFELQDGCEAATVVPRVDSETAMSISIRKKMILSQGLGRGEDWAFSLECPKSFLRHRHQVGTGELGVRIIPGDELGFAFEVRKGLVKED